MPKLKVLFLYIIVQLILIDSHLFAQEATNKKILWAADWSSDEKYIAVGGDLDTLKIYSSNDLKLYKSYPVRKTITSIKWHPFKNILAVGTQMSGDKVRIINIDNEKVTELTGISPDGARGIDWNYTGDLLAVADNDGKISIFNIDGQLVKEIRHENTKSITGIDWHPRNNTFITVGDKIRIFDFEGNLLRMIVHRKEEVLLLCVAWHDSGDFFVTGDYGDNQYHYKPLLQFWNDKGELLKSADISKGEYRNLKWTSKGSRLITASDALRIWDRKGYLISVGNSEDYLWGISSNKEGSMVVTSGSKQGIVLWNNKAEVIITREF